MNSFSFFSGDLQFSVRVQRCTLLMLYGYRRRFLVEQEEDDVRLAVLTKLDFNVYAASAMIMGDDKEL